MRRLTEWLRGWEITCFDLDKKNKRGSAGELSALLASRKWDLVYQEGTGIAGGLPLIRAARSRSQRYIYSIGDPVGGFFRVTKGPIYGALMERYERELARRSAGVIGWTPYLVGRALTMGAPRAATVEGAVALNIFRPLSVSDKATSRAKFGLPLNHIVCGVVGSLTWTPRQQYCYGLELIETLKRLKRPDISFLIVGDGDGRKILEERIPAELQNRVVFTGRLSETDVVAAMNVMDIGFIAQTLDVLGSFRLTTKLPEYLACGLPVAVSPIPGYFDYVGEAGWALPAFHPASSELAAKCALWLDSLCREEIAERAERCRVIAETRFAYEVVGPRFAKFVESVMSSGEGVS
jgi:hypothetical protein